MDNPATRRRCLDYMQEVDRPVTVNEIRDALGLNSKQHAHWLLRNLVQHRVIERVLISVPGTIKVHPYYRIPEGGPGRPYFGDTPAISSTPRRGRLDT